MPRRKGGVRKDEGGSPYGSVLEMKDERQNDLTAWEAEIDDRVRGLYGVEGLGLRVWKNVRDPATA